MFLYPTGTRVAVASFKGMNEEQCIAQGFGQAKSLKVNRILVVCAVVRTVLLYSLIRWVLSPHKRTAYLYASETNAPESHNHEILYLTGQRALERAKERGVGR